MFEVYRAAMWALSIVCLCLLRWRLQSGACVPYLFRPYISAEIAVSAASGLFLLPSLSGSSVHFRYFALAGIALGAFRAAAIFAVGRSLPIRPPFGAAAAGLLIAAGTVAALPWEEVISWQAALWVAQSGVLFSLIIGIIRNRGLRIGRNILGVLLWFAVLIFSSYLFWIAGLAGAPYNTIRWLIQPPCVLASISAFLLLGVRDEPVLVPGGEECRQS